MSNTLIHNAQLVNEGRVVVGWLLIAGPTIAAMGEGEVPPQVADQAAEKVDAQGALLLPGAIDAHVHFREPGMTRKATIASESRAAVAGGVTSYIDMPNNVPPTCSIACVEAKQEIAARDSMANYGFYIGATSTNLDELKRADYHHIAGVKLFMGSTTGDMALTDANRLAAIFSEVDARISVHAEDDRTIQANIKALRDRLGEAAMENLPIAYHSVLRSVDACVRATESAMELATRYGSRLHVCHVTTAKECSLFDEGDLADKSITAEVSPHHLLWTTDDYARLGARIKMNPAVKSAADREALRAGLLSNRLDIVATDHAPHLLAEKQGGALKAVSGAPMVQFSLAAMLGLYAPEVVAEKMSHAPARLFAIDRRGYLRPGYAADLVLVEKIEPYIVSDDDVVSLCHWTPMQGAQLSHRIRRVWVNGSEAYCDGKFADRVNSEGLLFN
jgi:dihydroorotase